MRCRSGETWGFMPQQTRVDVSLVVEGGAMLGGPNQPVRGPPREFVPSGDGSADLRASPYHREEG